MSDSLTRQARTTHVTGGLVPAVHALTTTGENRVDARRKRGQAGARGRLETVLMGSALSVLLALVSLPAVAQTRAPQPPPRPGTPASPSGPAPNGSVTVTPAPAAGGQREPPSADSAYSAYQRGRYLTAFREATERVEAVADPVSMVLLAELHASGIGIPQNEQRALGWYRLAAERGDRNAIFAIGMMHVEGRAGLEKDPAKAKTYFEQAAGLGHAAAAYNLGLLAFAGQAGSPRDPAAAAMWFRKAADLGNADAQYAYAVMLKDGNGITADAARAADYMARAAAQDLMEAQIDYGVMLFNGVGVGKDEAAAAALFRKAALRGNPLAMNRYARLLAIGRGVTADPTKAAQWYMFAEYLGASDAWLRQFVQTMDPVQREAAERAAQSWVR